MRSIFFQSFLMLLLTPMISFAQKNDTNTASKIAASAALTSGGAMVYGFSSKTLYPEKSKNKFSSSLISEIGKKVKPTDLIEIEIKNLSKPLSTSGRSMEDILREILKKGDIVKSVKNYGRVPGRVLTLANVTAFLSTSLYAILSYESEGSRKASSRFNSTILSRWSRKKLGPRLNSS